MRSAAKLSITIPANHRVEITLPSDMPAGPADVFVVVTNAATAPGDLIEEEADVSESLEAALSTDARFERHGGRVVFVGDLASDAAELDHRALRDERIDHLASNRP